MMDSFSNPQWFLSKHEDGSVFGPMPFEAGAALGSPPPRLHRKLPSRGVRFRHPLTSSKTIPIGGLGSGSVL